MNPRRFFRKSQNIWGSKVPVEINYINSTSQTKVSCSALLMVNFEDLWKRRLHKITGQDVPVLCHPHSDKVILKVQRERPVSGYARCLWSHHWAQLSRAWLCPLYTLPSSISTHWWDPPEPSLLQQSHLFWLNSLISCSLYLHERCSKTFVIFVAIFWPHSFQTTSFFSRMYI